MGWPSHESRSRTVAAALLASCLLGSVARADIPLPAAAAADEQAAKQHFEAGRVHYENGDFVRAASEFEASYAQSGGRHELLYNLYLAYRDANLQDRAIDALGAYLSRAEVVTNRAMLESRLAALEQGQTAEPVAAEPVAAPPPVQEPHPEKPDVARKVPVGPLVLTVAGGAMALASVGTGLYTRSLYQDIEKSCTDGTEDCDPELETKRDRGQKLAYATDGLLFGGAALALTGGLWWWLSGDDDDEAAPSAALACDSSGCVGSYARRF